MSLPPPTKCRLCQIPATLDPTTLAHLLISSSPHVLAGSGVGWLARDRNLHDEEANRP